MFQPTPVQIGVSTVKNATGNIIYTGPTPAYGIWQQRTFTFVAPNNGHFISVSATSDRWTQVDNFDLALFLPVELTTFSGHIENQKVILSWTTASELNNSYFTIDRSRDGNVFETLLTAKGAGTSTQEISYSADDDHPFAGADYYRLSQTDYNGGTIYFKTIEVENEAVRTKLELIPNPTNGLVNFLNVEPAAPAQISVSDVSGRLIKTYFQIPKVLDLSSLPSGIYLVTIQQQSQSLCNYIVKE